MLRDKGNSIGLKSILPRDEPMGLVGQSGVPMERKLPMVPELTFERIGRSGQLPETQSTPVTEIKYSALCSEDNREP